MPQEAPRFIHHKDSETKERNSPERWYVGKFTLKQDGVAVVLSGHKLDLDNKQILCEADLNIEPTLDIGGNWAKDNDCYKWALSMLNEGIEAHFVINEGLGEITFLYKDENGKLSLITFDRVKITF